MNKVRVSSKFQIVIPRGLRERQKIRSGQELLVIEQGRGFIVIPSVEIAEMEGAIPGLSLDGIREEEDRF
jgi:AbrB family looped-hinge helix DNA binding protein